MSVRLPPDLTTVSAERLAYLARATDRDLSEAIGATRDPRLKLALREALRVEDEQLRRQALELDAMRDQFRATCAVPYSLSHWPEDDDA